MLYNDPRGLLTRCTYFFCTPLAGCNDPLSTEGLPCHITQAMLWLGPFLTYANFVQRLQNRTVLLDVGLGLAYRGAPTDNLSTAAVAQQKLNWGGHRFGTELQMEKFFHASQTFIREMQGGPTGDDPDDIPGAFHTWCFDNLGARHVAMRVEKNSFSGMHLRLACRRRSWQAHRMSSGKAWAVQQVRSF